MKNVCLFFICILNVVIIVGCGSKAEVKESTVTTVQTADTTTTTSSVKNVVDERTTFSLSDNMSKEVLKRHMENLFNYIEEKIAAEDFEGWYNSLSERYKVYLSDEKELRKMSENSDYFANRGIIIKNAKEFFELVVIQAREGNLLKFSDYKYIDKFNVKVICLLDSVNKFGYSFVYEAGSWKLDR